MINSKILKVVLAAGLSKRYGLRNKILEKINAKSIIESILENLISLNAYKKDIIIIGGNDYISLKKKMSKYDIKIMYNQNYRKGIGSSVSLILKKKITYSGIMFIPGDMPLITLKDYKKLIMTFLNNENKIISPSYKGIYGNPLIIPKIYFNLIKNLQKDNGARKFLPPKEFIYVPCSKGTIFDIDTKSKLLKAKILNKMLMNK
ncbi:MAG: hypothetical protein CMN44_07945 [SAR116 cluster bacterium]|nr:hypothetical protein [SAR116 cluster bacterium]RPH08931.1 MAG: nucleotidyltransferase family protein [Alphaproteobacteria bacterium TMED54]